MTSEQIKKQYDSLYASQKNVFGAGEPIDAVRQLGEHVTGGTVLDIGGGEGRNALYLAQQGFSVSVLDISTVGIERLQEVVKEQGLQIDTRAGDALTEKFDGVYDTVILSFVLHHIEEVAVKKLIAKAQRHTTEDGMHVLSTFMSKGELYERNKTSGRFYPSEETIRELYTGWNILELSTEEIMTHARNKSGDLMKNYTVTLIAKKAGV